MANSNITVGKHLIEIMKYIFNLTMKSFWTKKKHVSFVLLQDDTDIATSTDTVSIT